MNKIISRAKIQWTNRSLKYVKFHDTSLVWLNDRRRRKKKEKTELISGTTGADVPCFHHYLYSAVPRWWLLLGLVFCIMLRYAVIDTRPL